MTTESKSPRIAFRIERDVILGAQWFDQKFYDLDRAEGLSHEDAIRLQLEIALQNDPLDFLWEAFGEFATGLADSITNIDLVG